jgi:CheY-like chemotaxis protein
MIPHVTSGNLPIGEVAIERRTIVHDDRASLQTDDRVLLIIEDDAPFAQILLDIAHEKGFKAVVADRGEDGLAIARELKPAAITLDLRLPEMDGWTVLDRLKHDSATRHIPVHIISVNEDARRALRQGAIAYLNKPIEPTTLINTLDEIAKYIDRPVKYLLIIEDDPILRATVAETLQDEDLIVTSVGSGTEALEAVSNQVFDCVVLDLGLPDISGIDLIPKLKSDSRLWELPIVVYTGRDVTPQEEATLRKYTVALVSKETGSLDQLLDETGLFLHRVESSLSAPKRAVLETYRNTNPVLAGKKVLIIDDDIRNIFATTSVLEHHDMEVIYAENGREGIRILENTPDIDVVLLDIMMPEMDGFETLQVIRNQEALRALPIIAVTAKAMKGDREKCLEAGASDYITKPIDTDQLLALLRVWLDR